MTVLSPGQWLRLVVHPPLPCAVVFEEHAGKPVGAGPVATRGSKFSGAERGDDRDDAVNAHVQSGTGNREVDPKHVRVLPLPSGPLNWHAPQAANRRRREGSCEGFSDAHRALGGNYTVDASGRNPARVTPCCGPQDD